MIIFFNFLIFIDDFPNVGHFGMGDGLKILYRSLIYDQS